jgi:hypothetical protein
LIYYIHTFKFGIHIPTLAIYNAYIIYKYYVVVIIHYFIKEIEDEREYESANRFLTEKEVEEFEEGLIPPPFMCSETKALNLLQDQVIYMQYDKNSCEIEEQNLQIGEILRNVDAFRSCRQTKVIRNTLDIFLLTYRNFKSTGGWGIWSSIQSATSQQRWLWNDSGSENNGSG